MAEQRAWWTMNAMKCEQWDRLRDGFIPSEEHWVEVVCIKEELSTQTMMYKRTHSSRCMMSAVAHIITDQKSEIFIYKNKMFLAVNWGFVSIQSEIHFTKYIFIYQVSKNTLFLPRVKFYAPWIVTWIFYLPAALPQKLNKPDTVY